MLLKRIQAPTLQEALARVEKQCGKDALVVETRETRRGVQIVAASPKAPGPKANRRQEGRETRWTQGFREHAEAARRFGISRPILTAIEKALLGTRAHLERPGDPAIARLSARILEALIKTESMDLPDYKVTAFVGPTGVGKTTTLAKIAARAVQDGEQVAILTVDTWRIAAVEQLRAFADMLRAPFEVAFTPVDLLRAVQRHAGADRILIDTTGRGPFDKDAIRTLAGTIGRCNPSTVLCLAAGTRAEDQREVIQSFAQTEPRSVIVTKWDETRVPGETLSVAVENDLPLTHLTTGQRVPEDLEDAHPDRLAALAFPHATRSE